MMMSTFKYLFFMGLGILLCSCSEDATDDPILNPDQIEDTILFSKNPKGHNELYKLQNGVETVLLSDPNYDFWWPKVSPDKSRILVYRSSVNPAKNHDDYQNAELLVLNIDGSDPQVLIPKNAHDWLAQGVCRWNEDGTKIVMCAIVNTPTGEQWRLITTDNLGQNPKVLSDHWAIDCNLSPDNNSIVFMGFKDNELSFDLTKLELQKADYDKQENTVGTIVSLTDNNSRDHDPAFSPDNTKIVFSGGNAQYTDVDLLLYDLQTNQESVLLNDNNANGGSMCWSPDGKYVYFHSLVVLSAPFRIKRINIATKVVETILETEANDFGFYHPEAY